MATRPTKEQRNALIEAKLGSCDLVHELRAQQVEAARDMRADR